MMGFKAWETPKDFWSVLNEEFKFTLDAAASHENHLTPLYSTVDGTYLSFGGATVKLSSMDGLEYPWEGESVWCNPPYDRTLDQWVTKAIDVTKGPRGDGKTTVVLLLPPSVDTKWYHKIMTARPMIRNHTRYIGDTTWHGFSSFYSIEILFMEGRLKFNIDGVPGPAPRAGNMLVILRS